MTRLALPEPRHRIGRVALLRQPRRLPVAERARTRFVRWPVWMVWSSHWARSVPAAPRRAAQPCIPSSVIASSDAMTLVSPRAEEPESSSPLAGPARGAQACSQRAGQTRHELAISHTYACNDPRPTDRQTPAMNLRRFESWVRHAHACAHWREPDRRPSEVYRSGGGAVGAWPGADLARGRARAPPSLV